MVTQAYEAESQPVAEPEPVPGSPLEAIREPFLVREGELIDDQLQVYVLDAEQGLAAQADIYFEDDGTLAVIDEFACRSRRDYAAAFGDATSHLLLNEHLNRLEAKPESADLMDRAGRATVPAGWRKTEIHDPDANDFRIIFDRKSTHSAPYN